MNAAISPQVHHFQLGGLVCAACSGIVESALRAVPGVREASVNGATARARVYAEAGVGEEALRAAVRAAGYEAAPDTPESAEAWRRRERAGVLWRLFVAAFCAMQVMMLATPSYVATGDDLAPDLRQLLNWASWLLSLPVMGFSAGPYLRAAWRSLRRGHVGMEVPVSLGTVVTFVASTVATFDPLGPLGHEVYFDSLTMFLAFLWMGRWLEMSVRHRAAAHLQTAWEALPRRAWRLLEDGSAEQVSPSALQAGNRVRVPTGEALPADGTLLDDSAEVSEALLTGEPGAVRRRAGEALMAGAVNHGPPLHMRVSASGGATRLAAVVALMQGALSQRPATARLADRWAAPFLLAVVALAVVSACAWSLLDPSRAVWVAVSVLIVTCPCALSLATPATLVAAAGGLARRGLVLRRLEALENLARIDRVVFDKTGTLTGGTPQVRRVLLLERSGPGCVRDCGDSSGPGKPRDFHDSPETLEARAASLARHSNHPLARALAREARGGEHDSHWQDVREEAGRGVQGRDSQGRTWRLGAADWVGQGVHAPEARIWLGAQGRALVAFVVEDLPRVDAASVVCGLRQRGVEASMLTGDMESRARSVADEVGIADVHARLDPQSKLDHLRAWQARGECVAAVGDGINDAPLLAAADVSLAFGEGASLAQEGADAVIVGGRLQAVVDARDSARRALAIVRQNLVWAALYNAACIPLALLGWLPPWAAGLGMATSSALVLLNAQRAAGPASPQERRIPAHKLAAAAA